MPQNSTKNLSKYEALLEKRAEEPVSDYILRVWKGESCKQANIPIARQGFFQCMQHSLLKQKVFKNCQVKSTSPAIVIA
jgi:hypothetical protein